MDETAGAVCSSCVCTAHSNKYAFETKHFKVAISFLSAALSLYCLRDMLSEDYFLFVFVVPAKRPQRTRRCFSMIGQIFCEGITGSVAIHCYSSFALAFTALLRKLHLKAFLEILNVLMRVLLYTSEAKKDAVLGIAYHNSGIVTLHKSGNSYINCTGF